MEREHNGREEAKHISMELTADGARVTNLKLDGKRLILTIEAQLSDSHLTATDAERPAPASAPSSPTGGAAFALPPDAPDAPAPSSPFGPPAMPAAEKPEAANSADEPLRSRPAEQAPVISLDAVEPSPLSFEPMPPRTASLPPLSPPPSVPGIPQADALPVRDLSGALDTIFPVDAEQFPDPDAPPLFSQAAAVRTEPPAPDAPQVIRLAPESLSFSAPPAPFPAPPEAPAPGAQQPINPWGELPSAVPASPWGETPAPAKESRDYPGMTPDAAQPFSQPLAMAEESSTFGGARHGEPQPTISFGQDLPLPDFAPVPGVPSAPVAAPAQPPPVSPLPPPLPQSVPGAVSQDPFGFAPQSAPLPPPPPPMPVPPPAPAPAPAAGGNGAPEGGGTTVLIRYTCPKCKTQGMQAVDKVGTVVNCSNCGKAMRLVMKK